VTGAGACGHARDHNASSKNSFVWLDCRGPAARGPGDPHVRARRARSGSPPRWVTSRPGYASESMKRYHVTTFGCQMNEHDSERMKGMLESLGYTESDTRADADLILFNTCSIREKADDRFVAHLGEAKRVKRQRPDVVVGVGGCWAQSVKEEVFARFPFVDVAFGPGQVHKLAEFLTSDSLTAQGFFEFEGFTGHLPGKRARDYQAWVQISVGCNCRCSYCIVPSTRGREVSRPLEELVAEVERLAADGVREVTLLGQNVNSYGRDLRVGGRARSFSELLRAVDAIGGIDRIRYTSPHPKDMREDVIRAHAELESLCEHIHLPLQSGSSRVLKAMRRTYDRGRYLDRVALIREHVPDCALTTDIIVGFPGETEEDFAQTLEVCEEVGYDGAFTFVYSPRRGTEAAGIADGVVPHEVKVERMQRLVEVVQRRAHERAQRFVGRTVDVLVEGTSRTDASRMRGRSRHNKAVNFVGLAQPGEIVPVEIHSATSQTLAGEESLVSRATA
jgi:tRNA-2-methylthio-N6-dimethylallyladenosine synthase